MSLKEVIRLAKQLSTVDKVRLIQQIASSGDQVAFSSITLAEIVYLSEKGRISPLTLERLLASVDN